MKSFIECLAVCCVSFMMAGAMYSSNAQRTHLDPGKFPTRDTGEVIATCSEIHFIVSLNNDDDNDNRKTDLSESKLPKGENNLRVIVFPKRPDADKVYIAEPVLVDNGASAIGTRIRGWKSDGSTFVFDTEYDLPVKLLIEGIAKSDKMDEIRFEYQYKKSPDKWVCGGSAFGTVVRVAASIDVSAKGEATDQLPNGRTKKRRGSGSKFKTHRKMLIKGTGEVSGEVSPDLSHVWRHPRGTFADATALSTVYTAGTVHTPAADMDREPMLFVVTYKGQAIKAHFPVNITAPMHLSTGQRNMDVVLRCTNTRRNRCWFDAGKGRFSPVPTYRVRYVIQDQQHTPIRQSAYAGVLPQIRENIGDVMTSPIPEMDDWIDENLDWTRNWKSKPEGRFTDKIQAQRLKKDLIVVSDHANPGRRVFHAELRDAGRSGVLMHVEPPQHHIWFLGVNESQACEGTRNDFSSVVENRRTAGGGVQIQLRTRYIIHTP